MLADRPPAVTGAESRKALEIILAIYQSQRSGQPVRLPLTGPVAAACVSDLNTKFTMRHEPIDKHRASDYDAGT